MERVHFRSMVGRLLCGLLLAVVATVAPARAAQNELLSVHLTPPPPGGDAPAQVEIVMATEALPRHLELKRPHRFVLDLPATRARPAKSLPKSLGTLITAVRSGPQANGDLRLVFEMPAGAAVNWTPPTAPAKRFSFLVWPSAAAATATAKATATAVATAVAASPAPTTPAVVLAPVKTEHEPAEGREVVVAIDAGHGGQDPGAIGRGGLREKDVVLDIARELAARINREPGMRAFLTRDGDYFLTLRQRIRRARDAGAQLFVSVHADSVRDPRVSGSSVYVLSLKGATDEQARMLADRENAADL
ncbi:MAG: N-acetylmuramoyl-L-alanine amidase, partial [Gammaproteobacteria bacterium]|nr:N-acetylmuramoyl-L-alanine amidase [Gammaproteobacteria bacterium]